MDFDKEWDEVCKHKVIVYKPAFFQEKSGIDYSRRIVEVNDVPCAGFHHGLSDPPFEKNSYAQFAILLGMLHEQRKEIAELKQLVQDVLSFGPNSSVLWMQRMITKIKRKGWMSNKEKELFDEFISCQNARREAYKKFKEIALNDNYYQDPHAYNKLSEEMVGVWWNKEQAAYKAFVLEKSKSK